MPTSRTTTHVSKSRILPPVYALRITAIALVAAFSLSCESGGSVSPTKETPVIANITGSKTAVEIGLGTTTTVDYVIQRGGGYNGSVTFSVDGIPAGVTASFTPSSLDKSTVATTLKIAALPTASALSKTLTVTVTGEGVDSKSLPLVVTVVVPSLSVSAGAGPFSTVPEAPLVIPLNITRVGVLTDVVTLTVQGLPNGVTATLSTSQLSPDVSRSTLTLTPAFLAKIGSATINVHAVSIDAATDLAIPITINDFSSPTFRLSPTTSSLQVVSGSNASTQINVLRSTGFTAPVTLIATGAPAGSVVAIQPSPANNGEFGGFSISLPSTLAVGTYPVTVHGTAQGLAEQTTTITIVGLGPRAFTLNASDFTSGRNLIVPLSMTIARTGAYNAGLAVTLDLQAGFTVNATNINPTTVSTTNFTINLAINGTVAPGPYQLTFRATGTDGLVSTKTITATITN